LNEELRKLHNQKRLLHESPPLEFDEDLAKKLQAALDRDSVDFYKDDFDPKNWKALDEQKPAGVSGEKYGKTCGKNVYKHERATSQDINSVSKAAAERWYSGHADYDYKTGDRDKFDEASTKRYQDFARMMWRSSTKVAFGMINRPGTDTVWVVGYYCYDKPDVCVSNCDKKAR